MFNKMRGVTLFELLIVIVIVGILAAFAYPNYRDFAARAKRNEAKAALLQIATNQERVYLNTQSYTEDMTKLGFPVPNNFKTGSETYIVTIVPGSADAKNFTAVATYQKGDNEATKCLTFQIDARGQRKSAPLGDCWTRTR